MRIEMNEQDARGPIRTLQRDHLGRDRRSPRGSVGATLELRPQLLAGDVFPMIWKAMGFAAHGGSGMDVGSWDA